MSAPLQLTSLTGSELAYGVEDGHVTFRSNGKPGRRKVLQRGDPDWREDITNIPLVDFQNHDHPDINERRKVAKQLANAAERVGFWYAVNSPVDIDLITLFLIPSCRYVVLIIDVEETFDVVEEFFALPHDVKEEASWTKSPGSLGFESFAISAVNEGAKNTDAAVRESFAMSHSLSLEFDGIAKTDGRAKTNIFPGAMPKLREVLERYYTQTSRFALSILRLFALELGIEEEDLIKWQPHPSGAIRPAHYPPQDPRERAIGHLAHTDSTFFSMVLQSPRYPPGLDILDVNGQWIRAPYQPGASFTCNVGDYLEHWSDGRFRSTVHRVLNNSERPRFSVPYFFSPDPRSVVTPVVPAGKSRKTPKEEYEDKTVGDLIIRRFMYARRNHPTAQKVISLGIPEKEWKYDFLVNGVEVK